MYILCVDSPSTRPNFILVNSGKNEIHGPHLYGGLWLQRINVEAFDTASAVGEASSLGDQLEQRLYHYFRAVQSSVLVVYEILLGSLATREFHSRRRARLRWPEGSSIDHLKPR